MRRTWAARAASVMLVSLVGPLLMAVPDDARVVAAEAAEDGDGDGVPDSVEQRMGTDRALPDSDGDGKPDGEEDPDHDRLTVLFELRKSRTDPIAPDSDHDGIRDGAEDHDQDKLGDHAEQRFRTDPWRSDTDRDGRNDWNEDADHDGRRNGLEQDRLACPRTSARSSAGRLATSRPHTP